MSKRPIRVQLYSLRESAALFQTAAELLKPHDLHLVYHNH